MNERLFEKIKRGFGRNKDHYKSLIHLLNVKHYDTDKDRGYLNNYEQFFRPIWDSKIKLLEIGVNTGGSLLLWRDYFIRGVIAGLDVNPVKIKDEAGRIHIYQGLQHDRALLDKIGREIAPNGFDVIIDDASHFGDATRASFRHLFLRHLKSGGLYVIEDWGTGYWDSWPDGKSYEQDVLFLQDGEGTYECHGKQVYPNHSYGMVGFVKELVDECGMGDITKSGLGISLERPSLFQKIQISPGQVFVLKNQG